MASRADITPELIRQLISFENGRYYWRVRPREDFNHINTYYAWHKKYAGKETLNTPNGHGYFQVRIKRLTFLAHRVVWAYHYGEWPSQFIDHIDGNRTNNSLDNLRVVSKSENGRNQKRPKRNTSGVIGVGWHHATDQWRAYIVANGVSIALGFYDHIDEAIAARRAAEKVIGFHPNHGRAA